MPGGRARPRSPARPRRSGAEAEAAPMSCARWAAAVRSPALCPGKSGAALPRPPPGCGDGPLSSPWPRPWPCGCGVTKVQTYKRERRPGGQGVGLPRAQAGGHRVLPGRCVLPAEGKAAGGWAGAGGRRWRPRDAPAGEQNQSAGAAAEPGRMQPTPACRGGRPGRSPAPRRDGRGRGKRSQTRPPAPPQGLLRAAAAGSPRACGAVAACRGSAAALCAPVRAAG